MVVPRSGGFRSPVDAALVGVAYADEGGGVNDREIFDQDRVDEGEDGGVGSDAIFPRRSTRECTTVLSNVKG